MKTRLTSCPPGHFPLLTVNPTRISQCLHGYVCLMLESDCYDGPVHLKSGLVMPNDWQTTPDNLESLDSWMTVYLWPHIHREGTHTFVVPLSAQQ